MAWFAAFPYVLIFGILCSTFVSAFVWKHHNNDELLEVLEDVHSRCPNNTRIYTLSETSVRGIPLYVMEFATRPGHHQPLVPEFKYIANMHGNEVLGRELLLGLVDHLCSKYLENDPQIRLLLHTTRIHILPSMNPDGWQTATDAGGKDYLIGRKNNHSVDLNRNFPDLDRIMFTYEKTGYGQNNHLLPELDRLSQPIEPETRAVMRLIMQVPFVLSANLHGGDLVANYPYDESRSGIPSSEYSGTPDDDTFRDLALTYATLHADMASPNRKGCNPPDASPDTKTDPYNFGVQGGITNGAQWYSLEGGMQDFNYLSSNDFELTLELGCNKYPDESRLVVEWERNRDALIGFIWKVHSGIMGMIRDPEGRGISGAVIRVRNITDTWRHTDIQHDVTSVHAGDYYRLLTAGTYEIIVHKEGFMPQTKRVRVRNQPYKTATRADFTLRPLVFPKPEDDYFGSMAKNVIPDKRGRWKRDENASKEKN
ncbi:carboxypeptidase E-like isoform X2 [Arctopsyche grandis]|uniref:carboxypeptidase E-like isoform X2 n=1 Tax=Arctopsyche grandis TaxID=121162 RepID=UPI00406D7B0F